MHNSIDKAGRSFWDNFWEGHPLPEAVNPHKRSFKNHVDRRFHDHFVSVFADADLGGHELLEVGCGRSRRLPYFAKEFGFSVTGIDYSPIGCDQARSILEKSGVRGRIVMSDFSTPPDDMLEAFDVVVSFGVVEHFSDTASCVAELSKFLKPGGLMITEIPNYVGLIGWLQKRLCRSIFDVHVPLDRESLKAAHEQAGLLVLSCKYFHFDFSTLGLWCWSEHRLYGAIRLVPLALSLPLWALQRMKVPIKPNRVLSTYIFCEARK